MLVSKKTVALLLVGAVTLAVEVRAQAPPPAAPEVPEPPSALAVESQTPPPPADEPAAPAPPAAPRAPSKPAKPVAPGAAPPAPAAPAPPVPEAIGGPPPLRGERVNVRVDLRLKVMAGGTVTSDKPLSVVTVGDGSKTGIRSSADVQIRAGQQVTNRNLGLNADVRATVDGKSVDGKRVFLSLTLSYTFMAPAPAPDQFPPMINLNCDGRTVLEDGKPLVISDQVDTATDHRLIVEAKATILR